MLNPLPPRWRRPLPLPIRFALSCLLLCAALPALRPACAQAEPVVEATVDAPATLFWLLSALSGDSFVDGASWAQWWQSEGLALPEDASQVAAFGRLRATYRGRLIEAKVRDNPWVPVPPPPSYRLDVRFAAVFLGARDLTDISRRAEVLLVEGDQEALQQVVQSFGPRVERLLERQGWLAKFNHDFRVFSQQSQLPAFMGAWGRFLGAPPEGRVRVHFIPSPPSGVSHGRRLGHDLLVEVRDGDTPRRRSDVVVHEAIHWQQERAGMDDDPRLIDAIYATSSPAAARTWELLSEGVATAIGQGVWQALVTPKEFSESMARKGGWYVDDAIDPFAKAVYPALQAGKQGTLVALAAQLVQAAEALPPPVRAADLLRRYVLISNYRDAQWMQQAWWQHVPPRAVWRADLEELEGWLGKYRGTTLVVAATWAELAGLTAEHRRMLSTAIGLPLPRPKTKRSAALGSAARAGGARLLLAVAATEGDLAEVMRNLATGSAPAAGLTIRERSVRAPAPARAP